MLTKIRYKKAVVTGGAGFIGSHLVEALLTNGCQVTVIDNLSTGSLANLAEVKDRINFFEADIRDQEVLNRATKGCDIIFHQAARVSVPMTIEHPVESAMINDVGTLMVLEAARMEDVKKVVFASTCAVYGDDPGLPKDENMFLRPMSPYAVHKLAGEHYCRLYHDLHRIETVCLRYFNVFGPKQDPSSPYSGVISIFMTKAVSGETPVIYGDGNQYRDFVFVKDVVNANLLAANSEGLGKKIFNIGTGNFIRIHKLWKLICQITGVEIEPDYLPARPGDIQESVAGIELAKSALGFKPDYSLKEGLEITLKWYRKSGAENHI
ncbi:MAG: SDR family oxidoreductase [Desulfobacterales bacterium]